MHLLDDFRDPSIAKSLLAKINEVAHPNRSYRIMEFCGGHTHTLFRYGIPALLPPSIKMLHGPGCPVCILPTARVDQAIFLAKQPKTILCTYGDVLRVPGTAQASLLRAQSEGAHIKMIYSPSELLTLASKNPDQRIVFFAVGFETTTPPTAAILRKANELQLENIYVHCNHVLTPPAVQSILSPPSQKPGQQSIVDGIIGPGHVGLVTGYEPFEKLSDLHNLPITVSGFEPLDLLQSILDLVVAINEGQSKLVNEYSRAVNASGNSRAKALIDDVFVLREQFEWRGLGMLSKSALAISQNYARFDAEHQLLESYENHSKEYKACECPAVLRGQKKPVECPLFKTVCTPENPLGSCMVSSEGACAAYYQYG